MREEFQRQLAAQTAHTEQILSKQEANFQAYIEKSKAKTKTARGRGGGPGI
jgi:hypothetical protein